jgi:DNA-binding response OmpR family regulator
VRARALEAGVLGYLAKPFTAEEILACVGSAIQASKPRPE